MNKPPDSDNMGNFNTSPPSPDSVSQLHPGAGAPPSPPPARKKWMTYLFAFMEIVLATIGAILVFNQNKLMKNQNHLLEYQNEIVKREDELVDIQTQMMRSSYQDNKFQLFGSISQKLTAELDRDKTRTLSKSLIGEIAAYTRMFQPVTIDKNLTVSQERGHLLQFLIAQELSRETYIQINKFSDFSYADMRNFALDSSAVLDYADLKYAHFDHAFFKKSSFAHTNFDHASLPGALFIETNLDSANFSYCDLTSILFHKASIIGTNFNMAFVCDTPQGRSPASFLPQGQFEKNFQLDTTPSKAIDLPVDIYYFRSVPEPAKNP